MPQSVLRYIMSLFISWRVKDVSGGFLKDYGRESDDVLLSQLFVNIISWMPLLFISSAVSREHLPRVSARNGDDIADLRKTNIKPSMVYAKFIHERWPWHWHLSVSSTNRKTIEKNVQLARDLKNKPTVGSVWKEPWTRSPCSRQWRVIQGFYESKS